MSPQPTIPPGFGLDPDQEAAVNVERNAVVSSGAGSGKTKVLAERFVRLIRDRSATVDQILTLTFTRKAAAEMYERIYRRLLDEPGEAAREAVARFDTAQISTLDSFCQRIARESSERFGVSRDFSLAPDGSDPTLRQLSLRFVLEHHDSAALAEFIYVNGLVSVCEKFLEPIARTYVSIADEHDFPAMAGLQLEALRTELPPSLAELLQAVREIERTDSTTKAITNARALIAALPDLEQLAASESYEELAAAVDSINFDLRLGNAKNEALSRYKELVVQVRSQKERVADAVSALASQSVLEGMFELLRAFQETVLDHKRNSGVLSFHDVVDMAVAILAENHEVRAYYASRFRYVMIDEFQDNNATQKRLLYLLASTTGTPGGVDDLVPDKLFFVGDAKQSIYRFRGADVSVFRGLASELENHGGAALRLGTNYRSSRELVTFFNRLFPSVMPPGGADYEATFESLESGSSQSLGSTAPPVRIFLKPYEDQRAGDEVANDAAEALHIARFISDAVRSGSLPLTGRAAGYDDFALLMRSATNQLRYEQVFRQYDIPYAAQNVRALFLEAPLNDLYYALQAAAYPSDRYAYAALLRSPLVNLSDDAVVRLLLDDAPFFAESAGLERCTASDRVKFERGRALVVHLRETMDRIPLAELVTDLWHRSGYRYYLMKNRNFHGYLEYHDYFRALAERFDQQRGTLAQMLDSIRPNLGTFDKLADTEIVRDNPRGVQLLTIHAAKGLEFPVVILANAGNSGRPHSEASAPFHLSAEHGLTLRTSDRPNYFYRQAEEEYRSMELAEAKRLLYVAATRASSYLIVSGCHNRTNRPRSANDDVLLNMTLTALGWNPEEGSTEAGVPIEIIPPARPDELSGVPRGAPSSLEKSQLSQLLNHYRSARVVERKLPRTEWSATALNAVARRLDPGGARVRLPALSVEATIETAGRGEAFGTLCHHVLENRIRGRSVTAESLAQEVPPAVRLLVTGPQGAAVAREADALASAFLQSSLGIEAQARRPESEGSFLYRCTAGSIDCFISGTFDLLFLRDNEAVVIDFKTDRERVDGEYAVQLEVYRRAAKELTGRPGRAILWYLRERSPAEPTSVVDLEELLAEAMYAPTEADESGDSED